MGEGAPVDVATVLCQWATGGLAYLWVTTRRREVGLGYGWLLRSLYGAIAIIAAVTGFVFQPDAVRDLACIAMAACAGATLVRSVLPTVPAAGPREPVGSFDSDGAVPVDSSPRRTIEGFDPRWDFAAPLAGVVGVVAAGLGASGDVNPVLHLARVVAGTAFLGVVSNSMLLGHWYLVQPACAGSRCAPRQPGLEVGLLLLPTGMIAVLGGSIDAATAACWARACASGARSGWLRSIRGRHRHRGGLAAAARPGIPCESCGVSSVFGEQKEHAVRMVLALREELGASAGTVTRVAPQLGYGVVLGPQVGRSGRDRRGCPCGAELDRRARSYDGCARRTASCVGQTRSCSGRRLVPGRAGRRGRSPGRSAGSASLTSGSSASETNTTLTRAMPPSTPLRRRLRGIAACTR